MEVELIRLGKLPYSPALELQRARQSGIIAGTSKSALFLVEHEPVITLGANFHPQNLSLSMESYAERGIEVVSSGRGGDVTFHGPGQLVAYPVFDLREFGKDLHRWLRSLEEVFIRAVEEFGLAARRVEGLTGVWVGENKIAAIGVQVRRWVSIHGVALNCNLDLEPFSTIVPCGIQDRGVTSLSKELNRQVSVVETEAAVLRGFETALNVEFDA